MTTRTIDVPLGMGDYHPFFGIKYSSIFNDLEQTNNCRLSLCYVAKTMLSSIGYIRSGHSYESFILLYNHDELLRRLRKGIDFYI